MNCQSCKHWVPESHYGACKRFPTVVAKPATDWCGEWADKVAKGLPPVEEVLDNFPVIKRKPGRPKTGE